MTKQIRLRYFALLRDQAGQAEETRRTLCATATELYAELAAEYGFTLPAERVRVAVNGEFVRADHPLKEGDLLVFIPPVSGG